MSAKCFIDSNIFIYAFCDKIASKQIIAKDLILDGSPTISVQVINEVSNNLLKKIQCQSAWEFIRQRTGVATTKLLPSIWW